VQVPRFGIARGAKPPVVLPTALVVTLLVGSLLVGGQALAQSKQLTKRFQAGVDAYRLGDYDEARAHLESARELDPSLPGPHRFLAAVAKAQERFDDCVANAATALRVAPQSREAADTRKLHEDCRVAGGRAPFEGAWGDGGALAVTARDGSGPAYVQVELDGKSIGSTPLSPRALAAGTHTVRVGAGDVQRVEILPGVVTDVQFDLGSQGVIELPAGLVGTLGFFVEIDGKRVAAAAKITVAAGSRRIRVGRTGAAPWSTTIEVVAGKSIAISPVLSVAKKKKKR
jgi:hypothetical protein